MASPDGTATLIDQLRAGGTALIYDPVGRILRADGHDAPSVTIGRDHLHPHRNQGEEEHLARRKQSTRRGRRLSAGDDRACP